MNKSTPSDFCNLKINMTSYVVSIDANFAGEKSHHLIWFTMFWFLELKELKLISYILHIFSSFKELLLQESEEMNKKHIMKKKARFYQPRYQFSQTVLVGLWKGFSKFYKVCTSVQKNNQKSYKQCKIVFKKQEIRLFNVFFINIYLCRC